MANIDNLNFKVIIDDKQFNQKIKAMEETAKKFNTSVSNILNVQAVSQELVVSNRKMKQIETDNVRALERQNREKIKTEGLQRRINAQIERASKGYQSQSRILQELKGYALGYLSVHGVSQVISSLVRVTGEFELQKTTLAAMLGDLNQAEQVITRIQGLAVESPFQFKELTTYAKQLSAFSVPAEELYDTTKMLADVSAGLGVGMDRIVLAYGQVRSAAFLRGQEVRQFTEAGIPILDELAKQFTELEGRAVSAGEVFDKISARLVPFEMVAKVFKDMTSEGGKFYEMQEIQAETLRGKLSNLKDAYEMMLNEIGSAHSDKLKGAVDMLRSLMQNWEAIGSQIVYLIKLFGAYKTAVALLTISDTIAKFGGLTNALKQTAMAQKLLNSALLTNPYIAVGTAILAIVMALRNATRASREFKEEIDKIARTQYGEADKAVDRYNRLTEELQNATKGSHDYREAISKLNNEYGEYLPQLLDEKNALDLVKTSSDAVTASIYNRARARAYERSQQKTEDMYGESRDYYTSVFLQKLQDDGISEKAARDLFANFNEAIKNQADGWNPADVFNEVYKAYFSTTEDYFTEVGNTLNDIKQNTPFIRNIYGENTTGWLTARDALWNYAIVQNKVFEAEKEYNDILEARWGNGAKSDKESQKLSQITDWYDKQTAAINAAAMSEQERIERLKNLDISKLQLLVQLYEELDKDPNTARTDLLNNYREELTALTKQLDGWQKKVADALNPYGIKGKGAGDYGLFADESTSYLEYVNDLRNAYKGLAQQIADTADANPQLNAELKRQKEIIEAVAKVLNIDLVLSAGKGGKSEAQIELENQIDLVERLRDAYGEIRPYVDDKTMKDTLSKFFPDVKKEWIESLDFTTILKTLADKLEEYDEDAAKRLRLSIEKTGWDAEVERLKNLDKQYRDSAKAAGDYFEMLRKWSTENYDIEGVGLSFDISKIASDLDEKFNEIELRATKAKEMFARIDLDSEEEIAKVKEIFEKEFGADAWDDFWKSYEKEGEAKIKELADKQKEYEKKLAQSKVRDSVSKHVSSLLKDLDLDEWGDKNILQIIKIKKKLDELADTPVPISDALKEDLDKAGLTVDDFYAMVDGAFNESSQEVADELGKKVASAGYTAAQAMGELADKMREVAEASGDIQLAESAEQIAAVSQNISAAAQGASSGGWIGAIVGGVTDILSQIIDGFTGIKVEAAETTRNIRDFHDALQELKYQIDESEYQSVFGSDEYGKAVEALEKMDVALKDYQDAMAGYGEHAITELQGSEKAMKSLGGTILTGGLIAAWGLKESISKEMEGALAAYKAGYDKLQAMQVKTTEKGGFLNFLGFQDEYTSLKDLAPQLWDTQGVFDIEAAKLFLDTNTQLTEEQRRQIQNLIDMKDAYDELDAALESYVEGLYGTWSTDLATAISDAVLTGADAWSVFGKTASDTIKQLGMDMMNSLFFADIFEQFSEPLKKAIGDPDAMVSVTSELIEVLKGNIDGAQEWLRQFYDRVEASGIDIYEGSGTTDLGDGIKGITEDTANLLASYLNAIRADVSYSKTLWMRMDANIQRLADMFVSSPTLMEYQAQIAANTYDTAQATQSILADLRSVITSDSGDTAIRVYS